MSRGVNVPVPRSGGKADTANDGGTIAIGGWAASSRRSEQSAFPGRGAAHGGAPQMYLGLAMDPKDRDEIVAKARTVNRDIAIFQAKRDAKGAIAFDRI